MAEEEELVDCGSCSGSGWAGRGSLKQSMTELGFHSFGGANLRQERLRRNKSQQFHFIIFTNDNIHYLQVIGRLFML